MDRVLKILQSSGFVLIYLNLFHGLLSGNSKTSLNVENCNSLQLYSVFPLFITMLSWYSINNIAIILRDRRQNQTLNWQSVELSFFSSTKSKVHFCIRLLIQNLPIKNLDMFRYILRAILNFKIFCLQV